MTKKIIYTENAPKAIGPYSQAVQAGGLTFVSGQVAINPKTGDLMNASIEEQAEQVLQNLTAICKEANLSLSNLPSGQRLACQQKIIDPLFSK